MSSKAILLSIVFLSSLLFRPSLAGLSDEKQSLLDFLSQISQRHHRRRSLNWSPGTPVCTNWTGVACDKTQSHVVAVRLPGVGIYGPLPPNTIASLPNLQLLSLRSNYLSGPFPVGLLNISTLASLHLQFNNFSGPLPNFPLSGNLSVLDLSYNGFSGSVPRSIANLKQLVSLNLANNSLSGEIPDVQLPSLKFLDLANNRLNGSIPASFLRFPNSSFSGNYLAPLLPVIPSSPAASPFPAQGSGKKKKKLLGESEILGIAVGGFALVFIAVSILMLIVCSGKKERVMASGKKAKWEQSPEKEASAKQDENNSLVFFEGCNFAFDLEDLLRASAEVLGKGTFGTAYKAVLEDAATVVVKRLKEVGVGKKEFEQVMGVVGKVKHENVAELRAYYYSKDEKLVVYDYYSRGSVSSLIHGMNFLCIFLINSS